MFIIRLTIPCRTQKAFRSQWVTKPTWKSLKHSTKSFRHRTVTASKTSLRFHHLTRTFIVGQSNSHQHIHKSTVFFSVFSSTSSTSVTVMIYSCQISALMTYRHATGHYTSHALKQHTTPIIIRICQRNASIIVLRNASRFTMISTCHRQSFPHRFTHICYSYISIYIRIRQEHSQHLMMSLRASWPLTFTTMTFLIMSLKNRHR